MLTPISRGYARSAISSIPTPSVCVMTRVSAWSRRISLLDTALLQLEKTRLPADQTT
jgi:hypothetical protein